METYDSVFAKNQYDISTVRNFKAHINLIENKYIAKWPYKCSFEDQKEIENQVAHLLNNGLIDESSSPVAVPVTALKKTGEGNTKEKIDCISLLEKLKILVPESQPSPFIHNMIIKTNGCKWFSALDISSDFWSILIRKKDLYKTGYKTQHDHWQWNSLPCGLCNSTANF